MKTNSTSNIKKIIYFLLLTFLISWTIFPIYLLCGNSVGDGKFVFVLLYYKLTPMISALILQKLYYKNEPLLKGLYVSFKKNIWFLIAWIMPIVIFIVSISFSLVFPVKVLEDGLSVATVLNIIGLSLAFGVTINCFFALGEELGFRGFLFKQLSNLSFISKTIVIGILWGVWHYPIAYLGYGFSYSPFLETVFLMFYLIFLSYILNYILIKAKSIIATSIFYGTLNAISGFSITWVSTSNNMFSGMISISGLISLFLFSTLITIYDRFISKDPIIFVEKYVEDY